MKKKANTESVDQYTHEDSKRPNNPPVGLVTPSTDPDHPNKKYSYDPRFDPQLHWSGKKENSEFEVDTVSLHVHERIDPITILEKAMKAKQHKQKNLFHYFDLPTNNPPIRDAIDFYKHDQNWSNRLIAGDSLLVMNSLLEKEGMEGKIQMIYMDPPYGIKYGSNFQPFVNKKIVKDGNDEDLTQEPEMIKAFRDTWELGIHSYLSYLRNRLLLAKKLLTENGSIFVQISDENIHHVREIMDEIFGIENFISIISFRTATTSRAQTISKLYDYIIWYGKNPQPKTRRLFKKQTEQELQAIHDKVDENGVNYKAAQLKNYWNDEQIINLRKAGRLTKDEKYAKRLKTDFPYTDYHNIWSDTVISTYSKEKIYVVQTNHKVIERCILLSTDPEDIVLDPTCGSGTTAYVAEKWGRRWITCDTSRIAIALTKQRLITSKFGYYQLLNSQEGISSGFKYKMVSHIKLTFIANNKSQENEILYDNPIIEKNKIRISGPFTIESVPAPTVKSLDVLSEESNNLEISRETSNQEQWRDELLKTGIRGKNGQKIDLSSIQTHPATKWLHADGQTKEDNPKRIMVSFGPEHAPLEQRQVALAIEEAQKLVPKPKMIIFAAMQFDPEAAKDIDQLNWPDVKILKVEMNKDLLTEDLKRKRVNNESFWLMGQPDVELQKIKDKKYVITVNGFDYYNTRTGEVESGGSSNIAMWMLDTDYDGRSIYPQQIFFPMEGESGGWSKLAKTLQTQIDEVMIAKYQGTESIPFEAGPNKRAAVKIIDDRGIESLKIIELE